MKTLLFAAAASVALCAGAAQAQDSDTNYAGFYVGGSVGGAVAKDNGDETIRFDRDLNGEFGGSADTFPNFQPGFSGGRAVGVTPSDRVEDDKSTAIASARAGYDMQMGNWVFGVLGEFEVNNVRDSVSAFSTTPANYVMTRELDNLAAIRARVGYTWAGYLPYVTAGAAAADVNHIFSTTNGVNTFTGSGDDRIDGYQAGAGIEKKVGNMSVGLEYLFTSLDDSDYVVRASGGAAGGPFTSVNTGGTDFSRSEEDFQTHSVRVTAAYRF